MNASVAANLPATSPAVNKVAKPTSAPKTARKMTTKAVAKTVTKPATKTGTKTAVVKPAVKVPVNTRVKEVKQPQEKKPKLVRDSFTLPQVDHELLKHCKKIAVTSGRETKKSEVIRAAIQVFAALSPAQQLLAYGKLETIAVGRPKGK